MAVPPILPLDVERTEDVALTPDDLAYAEAVALPRVVPGHPRLAGSMTSSENVPLPRRRGLAGHRQARGGPFGPASLQDRLARRDGPL